MYRNSGALPNMSSSATSSSPSSSSSGRSKESSVSVSRLLSRSGPPSSSRRSPSPRSRRHLRSPSPPRRSSRRRSPGRRSRSPGRHSRSPGRHSRSPGRRSRSPGRHSRSLGRRSLSRHSESSVEQNLRITVGNDRYGIDTPERKRLSDRLGSPVDSLSDVDRDDLADGPIFSRRLPHPRSLERYPSHEENSSSPFCNRHDKDYRSRDVLVHQPDYGINYDHLQDQPRETDQDGERLRKSLYTSEHRGREPKRPRYERDDRVLDASIEPQGFLPGIRNYRKRSFSRSPSPTYLDKEFRELENARRRKEKEELNRNLTRELPGNDYTMSSSTNPVQSSEPRYLYRPDDAPAMPKKSILKKRVEDPSVQPEVFPNSSIKEPPLFSNPPLLPQRSSIPAFSLEVENFLKRFNKNAVAELTANKESQGTLHEWKPYSDQQQKATPFEQNSGNFLTQKEHHESTLEPTDRQTDFLLPHERASQDGSGFSRILGMMADSTSTQEKRRRSFPDYIEDEEKFLYGGDDDDNNDNDDDSPCTQKPTPIDGKEPVQQKVSSPPPPSPHVKPATSEKSWPQYEKIHDLLKTIGLDIGVSEIGKLAARTQERLHGKKTSQSPDRHSVGSHKPEFLERRRSRSNTHSPESNRKRSLSPSGSFLSSKDMSSVSASDHNNNKGQDNPAGTLERSVPPISIIPSAPPSLPNLSPPTSVSQYGVSHFPSFSATQVPQNYPSPTIPPPGYDAYGRYMAYATSGWPMYAQQSDPALSDMHGLVTLTVPPNPTRPNLRVIETVSTSKGTPDVKRDESVLVQIPTATSYHKMLPQYSQPSFEIVKERISDERNRASQKQKVIEEREKLKAEQEARQKKLHYLKTELNRLSKQQGEMLRKKRREKDGHKDPLLVEVNRLQENLMKEIAQLKMSAEAAEKKQSELDKVAQILGINIFEKPRKLSSENKDPSEKNKPENAKTQERTSGSIKESKTPIDKSKAKSPKPADSSSQSSKQHIQGTNIYDYYDTGNHWCKDCNTICGTMFDFFTHMHNKKHRQTLDPYNRPWASKTENETKQEITKRIDKIPVPAKGSEFLIPITGYYCQLCHEFFGDQISAEQHVKSHPHNEKYKKYIDENPFYEERRNLDRQAGLSVIQETERRLKRKQCEKQKEEKDEKTVKTARKEEPNNTKELGDGDNEYDTNKLKKVTSGQKCGIKLRLNKDDKEVEKKEEKKEDSPQESRLSSFGKFSWTKTERDEKTQGKDVALSKEESAEQCKDKESKSQSGKPNSKPIAIKLSGKTVIPHTSPWTPVVSTSSHAKIRPNLPVPTMVLRKSATATVSKPAPLNTFLSIKSSGATTKPLPVVKEGNPEIVLPPDIISKAFGGEVVVLKGSQEDAKTPAEAEEHEQKSVTKAIEHAKALEHSKACVAKAQEQAAVVAKAQELAAMATEQVVRMAKLKKQSLIFERPQQRSPLLPLPPRPPLTLTQQQLPLAFYPPLPLLPLKQAAILADDMAPGVSEDDKNILAMPMCPYPLPPPTVFRDHAKKIEKKNTSLAAGSAQDLYDVFYNSSVRSPADSKLVNSSSSDKGKLNSVEIEKSIDLLADSKPRNNALGQQSLQNVCNSPSVNKIPLDEETSETEKVETEKILAVSEESTELKASADGTSDKISSGNREGLESNSFPTSDSVSFHEKIEMGTLALIESSKNSLHPGKAELVTQLSESNTPVLESDSQKPSKLEQVVSGCSDDNKLAMQLSEDIIAPLEDISMKPLKCETSEVVMQFSESSVSPLKSDSKSASDLETAEFKCPDDNKLALQLLEDSVEPVENVSMKPVKYETSEIVTHFSECNALEVDNKNSLQFEIAPFKSCDDKKLAIQLSEDIAPVEDDVSMRSFKCETSEIIVQFSESNAPLESDNKKVSELETEKFKCLDDKALRIQLLEHTVFPLEDVSKKPPKPETAELTVLLPDSGTAFLEDLHKNPLEHEPVEFKSSIDKFALPLSEDSIAPLEDVIMRPSELETEVDSPDDKKLAVHLPEKEIDFSKKHIMRYVDVTNGKDVDEKLLEQQNVGVCDNSNLEKTKSDLEMKAHVTCSGETDLGRGHLELAEHQFALSQGDNSLFEQQIETKKERSVTTEDKQTAGASDLIASTWVSDTCLQTQLTLGPVDSFSKVSEEDRQIVVTDQSSSKEPLLNLKVDALRFDQLESVIAKDEMPQTSEIQILDPESKLLSKGDPVSFHNNSEQELLVSSQPKDCEAFNVVNVPESGETPNECATNVTLISSTLGKDEEINQQPLNCEGKSLQREEALGSISPTNDVDCSSSVELMFIKNDMLETSRSDMELNDNEETGVTETENASFPSVHSEMVQEPLDILSTEIGVEHLGGDTLTFTDINTGVLHTPAVGDFDLNTTYSELNFHQSATLTLNLNIENERESPKSDETKPADSPRMKTGLELESINFSLGDIEMEREQLGILPSGILNEDIIDSPKLETVIPISLETSKTTELGIDQPAVQSEMIDFATLTSEEEEYKFCSLVSDVTAPHVPSSSNGDTAEPNTSLVEMQDKPTVSKVLQKDVGKCGTSDILSLRCGGKNVQKQVPMILPDLKIATVEVGGSGDAELYNAKNEIQISGRELLKTEEENNDIRCEVDSKLTSEVTDSSSTEHLQLTSSEGTEDLNFTLGMGFTSCNQTLQT
ncbi:LOW QUALITY PROTEIN: zinc finger protein 318-like [Sceloporus undulatus]|uniref:LOW QUALITY PROTEIN: zinc finger protein 318-like n=1 Tax=Sceloporus undulatus TaxID=8520 RepID=UPI001C4C8E62|nr:LOW QUALITY PROTEIN: zinc finger protein 318-like [Sceloporus undulatus]